MSRALARLFARSRALARALCVVVFALVWTHAGPAQATSIAIVRPSRSSAEFAEALFRLQGELLALGLEVRFVQSVEGTDAEKPGTPAWFAQTAGGHDVDALIRVVGETAPVAVDVWIRERATGRYQITSVPLDPSADNAAETLAIRAIEVLRSSFLELDLSRRTRRPPPAVEPQPEEPANVRRDEARPLGLEAGAALLTSLDGVGPALMPLVRVDWALGAALAAEATLAGFGTRPTLNAPAGSATVAQQFALLGLCYCSPSTAGLQPLAGVAAGALRTTVSGRADAPERAHSIARGSLLLDARLGVRVGLPAGYHLALASHLHWAEPFVAIHFVDAEIASTGRPNLLFSFSAGGRL